MRAMREQSRKKGQIIMTDSIGVAVIGADMAGRSHAHAYRTAQTVFGTDAPPVRLVAIAEINMDFANHTRERYGFERAESSWQAIVDADDIDAVSIVVANHLHREIAEALLASGKHVLCEKPLASSIEDAESMVKAADASGLVAACGFSYRRSPAVSAIGEQIKTGALGEIVHFNGRYWCDYSADPDAPTSWRYEGPLGSGALADLGSHLVDMSEQLCGPIVKIDGAALPILIKDRPVPLGAALGHATGGAVSDERRPVTNEDIATFVAEFANGAAGTFSISRVAPRPSQQSGVRGLRHQGRSRLRPFCKRRVLLRRQRTRSRYQRLAAGDRRARSPLHCSRSIHAFFRHRPRRTRVLYLPGACFP